MPPVKQNKQSDSKIPTAGRRVKARAVPDFSKLHNKWANKLESGKACAKKPCTVAKEFNFAKPGTREKPVQPNYINEAPSKQDSKMKEPPISSRTDGVKVQKSLPKSQKKAPLRRNTDKEIASEEFQVDNAAFESIINNTGVSQESLLVNLENTEFKTPCKMAPKVRPQTEVRNSIYYTRPKSSKASTAQVYSQYVKRVVSRLTLDGNQKQKSAAVKTFVEDSAVAGSSPLYKAPKYTPMRHSIYMKKDDTFRHAKAQPTTPKSEKKKEITAQSARRVPRPCTTPKTPAARTPRTDQKNPKWKVVLGQSPKVVEVGEVLPPTTLNFDDDNDQSPLGPIKIKDIEDEENFLLSDINKLEKSRKQRHVSQKSVGTPVRKNDVAELDDTQTIREIEALLEADLAAEGMQFSHDLENQPPIDHKPPSWDPSIANKMTAPMDIYDNYEKIAHTAMPVSTKTLNRIPFGQLSSGEISRRSFSPTTDDTNSPDCSPKEKRPSPKVASASKAAEPKPTTPPSARKRNNKQKEIASVDSPSTPKQQRINRRLGSRGISIHEDSSGSGSPKLSLSKLSLNSPNASPLRTLSPNVKLASQRSPRSPLQKFRLGSPLAKLTRDSSGKSSKEKGVLKATTYRSPQCFEDQENMPAYISAVARVINDENTSPLSAVLRKSKSKSSGRLRKKLGSSSSSSDEDCLSRQDLNDTLSESMLQLGNLQSEAEKLFSVSNDSNPEDILNQLKIIDRKQQKLKELQENLQMKLLKSTKKDRKLSPLSYLGSTSPDLPSAPLMTQEKESSGASSPLIPLDQMSSGSSDSIQSVFSDREDQATPPVTSSSVSTADKAIKTPERCTRSQEGSVSSVDSYLFSPRPMMAGTAQLVDSPFSRDSMHPPIRTPLALRNEADLALRQMKNCSSLSSDELVSHHTASPELSIDGVDSSMEFSSAENTGRDSLELAVPIEHQVAEPEAPVEKLYSPLNASMATNIYSSPSNVATNVTSIFQRAVTVPSLGSLSLAGNLSDAASPMSRPTISLAKRLMIASAENRYEELLLDEEVSLYACRLGSADMSPCEYDCRPVDPVAKVLSTGDDTHIVPIVMADN